MSCSTCSEGKLVFQLADRRIEAEAGATIFAPRGTVHTYQNFSDQPARLAFIESLHAKYGLTTMGPPLG